MNYFIKTASLIALTVLVIVSCNDGQSPEGKDGNITTDLIKNPATATGDLKTEDMPVFEFEEVSYDFGSIVQGEKVEKVYNFKNAGKTSMIISSAQGSCGCTVPEFPKKPIDPGESGKIKVVFDSNGKSGRQNNSVTVVANTYPATTVLKLTGEVIAPGTR